MPSLKLRDRSLAQRSLLALVPVAVLAAVFALGVPGEGSGEQCKTDDDCRDGEACGEDKCQSTAGGCGGEQDSGIGAASNQAEGAFKAENNETLGLNRAGTTSSTGMEGEGEGSRVAYTVSIGTHSYVVVSANGDKVESTLGRGSFRTGLVTVTPVTPVPPVFVYYGGAPPMCGKGQEGSDWGDCPAGQTCQSFPGGGFVCSGGGGGTGEEGEGEGESQLTLACDSPTRDPTRSSLTDSSASCIRDYCDEDGNGEYDSGDLGLVLLNYGSARYDTAVEILPNGPSRFPRFNPSYSPEYPEGSGESVNADDLAKYLAMMVGGDETKPTKRGPCGPLPPAPFKVACDSNIWDPDSQCVRAYCDENGDGTIDAADLGLVLANYGPLSCDDSANVPCVPIVVSNVRILPKLTEFPRFNPAHSSDNGRGEGEAVNGLDLAVYLETMVGDTITDSGGCSLPDNPLKLACNTPTWDPALRCMRDYCDEDGNGQYDSADIGLVLVSSGSRSDPTPAPSAEALVEIRPKGEASFWFPRFNPAHDTEGCPGPTCGLTAGEAVDKRDVNHYLKTMAVTSAAVLICKPVNVPPVASTAGSTPLTGYAPLAVNLVGTASSDTDGTIASYLWQFGDGSESTTTTANHTYDAAGTYDAVLKVTDNLGASAATLVTIVVYSPKAPPPPPPPDEPVDSVVEGVLH